MSPHNQHTEALLDASVEDLPPEPVQSSPLALRPAPTSPNSSDSPTSYFHLPSALTLLQSTHRYSSYILSGFLGLHAVNTCIIPLITLISTRNAALSQIDRGFFLTRYLYRPSETVECAVVLVPLGVHVLTGLALRAHRIYRTRNLYGEGVIAAHRRQTRVNRSKGLSWPRIRALPSLGYSYTAASGWATLFFVSLHTFTTRYLPWKYGDDGETSVTIVTHALQKHPILTFTLYSGLIAASSFHIISGWGRWLKLTLTVRSRRFKNHVIIGTVAAWMVSLVQISRLEIFSRAVKAEYDGLYYHLWRGF
jgi:Protein of unknown function (DUF1691)